MILERCNCISIRKEFSQQTFKNLSNRSYFSGGGVDMKRSRIALPPTGRGVTDLRGALPSVIVGEFVGVVGEVGEVCACEGVVDNDLTDVEAGKVGEDDVCKCGGGAGSFSDTGDDQSLLKKAFLLLSVLGTGA